MSRLGNCWGSTPSRCGNADFDDIRTELSLYVKRPDQVAKRHTSSERHIVACATATKASTRSGGGLYLAEIEPIRTRQSINSARITRETYAVSCGPATRRLGCPTVNKTKFKRLLIGRPAISDCGDDQVVRLFGPQMNPEALKTETHRLMVERVDRPRFETGKRAQGINLKDRS
jgi:hypothetical protein